MIIITDDYMHIIIIYASLNSQNSSIVIYIHIPIIPNNYLEILKQSFPIYSIMHIYVNIPA